MDKELVITVPEAGRRLGIGRAAAYQAAATGQLPTIRIGRLLRVPVQALERLLDAQPASVTKHADTRPAA
jgi:excisionase family DNA binding protein